jgi:hypothetical protein
MILEQLRIGAPQGLGRFLPKLNCHLDDHGPQAPQKPTKDRAVSPNEIKISPKSR